MVISPLSAGARRSSNSQVSCTSCQAIAMTRTTVSACGNVRVARSSHCCPDSVCNSRRVAENDI